MRPQRAPQVVNDPWLQFDPSRIVTAHPRHRLERAEHAGVDLLLNLVGDHGRLLPERCREYVIALLEPGQGCEHGDHVIRQWHQVGSVALEALFTDRPQLQRGIDFRPPPLRNLAVTLAGKQQHPKQRPIRIWQTATRPPECPQLVITEHPRAGASLAYDGFRLEPIAGRTFETINVLINRPSEEPPRISEQIVGLVELAATLDGLHHRPHVVRHDLRDRTLAPGQNELTPD